MAAAVFRKRDLMRRATMEVEIYEPLPDRIAWHIGWFLMRLGARIIGMGGTAIHVADFPEGCLDG